MTFCKNLGQRPFGVSFLLAGWDVTYGFQIYQTDPSGNYAAWKAQCIGQNSASAQNILKTDYKEELTLKEGLTLAVKLMEKTMESTTVSVDKRKSSSKEQEDTGEIVMSKDCLLEPRISTSMLVFFIQWNYLL